MKEEVMRASIGLDVSRDSARDDYSNQMALYRQILAEKAILYDQLLASTRQLVTRNDIIVKNETEIIKLKFEIDIIKLEVQQRRDLILELNAELDVQKHRYKQLKIELSRLEKRVDQLTVVLKQKEDEIELLEEMLKDRDGIIEDLVKQIDKLARETEIPAIKAQASVHSLKPQKKLDWYRPIKGDIVDELIAKYFNSLPKPMPVKRLGDGFYIFGTRKIFVKLVAGKLVVRVGGGFMSIGEFMEQYASMEFEKVEQMISHGHFDINDFINGQNAAAETTPPKQPKKSTSRSPKRLVTPK